MLVRRKVEEVGQQPYGVGPGGPSPSSVIRVIAPMVRRHRNGDWPNAAAVSAPAIVGSTSSGINSSARNLRMTGATRSMGPGWLGMRGACATMVVIDTNNRPPCSVRVIDRIRARPLAINRASRRVFSLDRSRPITGATRWRRSASRRIAPVVKRIRPRSRRRILKRGNPTRRPQRRRPCLESASCVRPRPDRQSHRRRPPWSTAPPRGDLVLGLVPVAVDGGKTPRQCGDRRVGVRASRLAFTRASAQL